ncbi:MAG: glycosyltransferase N-terminal domain-containing protein [Victivallales bacterium]|nr:glycosyltransferase N-terminal domain-containing protein [Victivallales bacterium]
MIIKLIRRPGYKKTFWERFAVFSAAKKKVLKTYRGAVWVHAVSVGEVVIAAAMIAEWQRISPERKFVLSTTTTTGQELARRKVSAEVAVIYCPLDFIVFVRRVLGLIRPVMLVIFETEIWPNMIAEARRSGAKVALVNSRMSARSARGYYYWRRFFRPLLEQFDIIGVQTLQDKERFTAVAPHAPVEMLHNMKFDQKIPENFKAVPLERYFGKDGHQILLAASTHPGEEKLIAQVFAALKGDFPALRLVIVPRHAERGGEIAGILAALDLPFRRRSEDDGADDNPVAVLLADTTGEMLGLMQSADVVIMGKSLAGQNEGHNIIEPALLGKAIVTGNTLKNFRFILDVFKNDNALITIDCDEQLEDVLRELFSDPERCRQLGSKARQVIELQRGATANTIKSLEAML